MQFKFSSINNFILIINELVSKSFSFILFWLLGIKLIKEEFAEFLLEMPFIFLFSTVLSFGSSTYFLEQKKSNSKVSKINMSFSLGLVSVINLTIIVVSFILYYLNIISFEYFLVLLVTISFNINKILTEYYFVIKKYSLMALTSISPKLMLYIGLIVLNNYSLIDKSNVYYLLIFTNLIFSVHLINNTNFKFTVDKIIKYFQFTWILTLQPLLIYLAYVSFRYFINLEDDSSYLIEFSVMQTYMGFFALLVSVSNRFIIHDLYEVLISKSINGDIKQKFYFFNKMFFLFSFLYLQVVIYYLDAKLNIDITFSIFLGMFFIVLTSLLNYVFQYFKSAIIFNKKFSYILRVNVFTTLLTGILSFACLFLKLDILYTISMLIVNLVMYIFYIVKIDKFILNNLISTKFIYRSTILISCLFLIEYCIYFNSLLFVIVNVFIMVLIVFDLLYYLTKFKKINNYK